MAPAGDDYLNSVIVITKNSLQVWLWNLLMPFLFCKLAISYLNFLMIVLSKMQSVLDFQFPNCTSYEFMI